VHITNKYPAALHLNSLYCGQQFEPPSKWIQANTTFPGFETPVMDDYAQVNHPFLPLDPLMKDQSQGQPRPSGQELLWKSTTLKFHFNAWVPETYADIYIVQQKTIRDIPDPWRTTVTTSNDHGTSYLPYTLPQWKDIGSKPMSTNWIDRKQYKIIKHRRLFLDSMSEQPPYGIIHQTADNLADLVGGGHEHSASHTKPATTHADRFCSITIRPNMVVKCLKYSQQEAQAMSFDANPAETKTIGPYSYDNIDPKQNIWCIVTTSDTGHDQLAPEHAVRFSCMKTNVWRDRNEKAVSL
jgi:hypothetical protein